jgi:hypothetical protein
MKVWPFGVGLRGRASNHPELRWLKTVVVSVREKAHEMRQVGIRKTYQKRPVGVIWLGVVVEASKSWDGAETGGPSLPLGMSLAGARVLARWCPAQRRREPGLLLLHGT